MPASKLFQIFKENQLEKKNSAFFGRRLQFFLYISGMQRLEFFKLLVWFSRMICKLGWQFKSTFDCMDYVLRHIQKMKSRSSIITDARLSDHVQVQSSNNIR